MLAYNQFSTSTTLQTATANGQSVAAGGFGRVGAQKIVILETDGMVNQATDRHVQQRGCLQLLLQSPAVGHGVGLGQRGRHLGAERRHADLQLDHRAATQVLPRRSMPVVIYCIAFGAIFEPTASGSEQTDAVAFLQSLATIGGTTFPSSSTDPDLRLLVVHRDPQPASDQAPAGIHQHHGSDRIDHLGEVKCAMADDAYLASRMAFANVMYK